MSAPIDGGAGETSSAFCCCCCCSYPKDCVAGISAGVITSAMAAIPSRDNLVIIAHELLILIKRIFPDHVLFLSKSKGSEYFFYG
jgi:hypothetical protein